jgi:Na+-driven multidrug efflux pump
MPASNMANCLLVGFTLGFGNGLSIVVARNFGSGNKEAIKKSVALSLILGLAITIVITLGSRFFLYPLLKALRTPEAILQESYVYISTITLFIVVMFGYNLCASLLRAIGNSFAPLIFLVISSILNISLDIFFIVNLKMGINGAAIATAIAQGVSVVLCLLYIKHKDFS